MPSSIDFDVANGQPAKINYSVPLPGQITGRRILQLDLGLSNADFNQAVAMAGQSYAEAAGISKSAAGITVDPKAAASFMRKRLLKMGHDSRNVELAVSALPDMLAGKTVTRSRRSGGGINDETNFGDHVIADDHINIPDPVLGDPLDLMQRFADNAVNGVVIVPGKDAGGSGNVEEVPEEDIQTPPNPQLFLIEEYGVSSFLGDYGMGKTVKTFTLLPGESTTIKLKTWQSTEESIQKSSSIIDSHEQSAKDRFSNKVQNETTDKKTKSKTEKWAVEAEAKASWGWGSAKVKASAEGEYHSGREQFSKAVTDSVSEHAKEASSKRELSVTSSSEIQIKTGEETTIERTISNVNMRRVLNFVFRELNQTYTTKIHLKNIYVGFTNEREDTWRQVPISGLKGLLDEVLAPVQAVKDDIASRILKVAGTVFSANDTPVRVLEKVTYNPIQDTIAISPIALDANGKYGAPTQTEYYRFQRGPLGQAKDANPVEGVLLSEQSIVMRTDSVIVEALLGESDALDNYSMEIQEAAATKETLSNQREALILATLNSIADPVKRAEAAALLFNPEEKES